MTVDLNRLRAAYEKVRDELLAERTPDGHWVGELSSSALSTATAISALAVVRNQNSEFKIQHLDELIEGGVAWLVQQQNDGGGFGDTDLSYSNIATTYLVVAALHLAGAANEHADQIARANAYINTKGRLDGLRERYGIDKTFVVPIITNLALAGLVDWREIDPLPFELACVPQSWYRFVGMPVVSYAIPALVAIGQARFFHAPPRNPFTRLLRRLSINRSLEVLRRMQPDSGGYLEATPLTSFVVMSLAANKIQNPKSKIQNSAADDVIREGVKFLVNSARPDGSWPIDTNLATWNTTLAINALVGAGEDVAALFHIDDQSVRFASDAYMGWGAINLQQAKGTDILTWLLSCQHSKRHAFTGATPGGFGWSDLSGAVPDADDTPGAILSFGSLVELDLREQGFRRNLIGNALCFHAIGWLQALQNRDGGWPTFCRGWGRLPFDRSGTDLTAHVLRAIAVTGHRFKSNGDEHSGRWIDGLFAKLSVRALAYLEVEQNPDGSWSPLWFGNQDHPNEENPIYGTAKVLMAYRDLDRMDSPEAQRGVAWLVANQNADGGWGSGVWTRQSDKPVLNSQYSVPSTPDVACLERDNPKSKIQNLKSSVEETALAVEALLAVRPPSPEPPTPSPTAQAAARGLSWLLDRVENNQHRQPAPIGFYFAKLWYYERLYPLIFTVAALGRACRKFAPPTKADFAAQPSEIRAP